MNRAERRKAKKKGKVATYNMTHDSIKGMVGQAYQQGLQKKAKQDTEEMTDKIIVMLLGLPCKVLMEQYGWGNRKRIPRFGEQLIEEFMNFEQSDIQIEQLNDWLFENCGFKFQFADE